MMKSLAVAVAMIAVTGSVAAMQGSGTPAAPQPERVELPADAGEALYWQGSSHAVLLAHGAVYDAASWTDQAEVMRGEGYSVLALEDISPDAIRTGVNWLLDEQDADGVVVIGASAGGGGALRALAGDVKGVAGLVLLSATGAVDELGDYPKLFTASEGEGMADRLQEMADDAPGDANQAQIIPGDAHAQATFRNPEGEQLLDVILRFLNDDAAWPAGTGTPEG